MALCKDARGLSSGGGRRACACALRQHVRVLPGEKAVPRSTCRQLLDGEPQGDDDAGRPREGRMSPFVVWVILIEIFH